MHKIIITLLVSIAVFVGTLVVTNTYITSKSIETADYINSTALDNFQTELDGDILLTRQSVFNFLSGISAVTISKDGESVIFDESHLTKFKNKIDIDLRAFMKVNRYYGASMFIFDEEINRKYYHVKGCYAPALFQGDSTLHIISDHYDFTKSRHFQRLRKERKMLWTTPDSKSPVTGQCMTFYVPISMSNGTFIGAFAVSIGTKVLNNKLKRHLPYSETNSGIFLADRNDNIFSASQAWILEPKYEQSFRDEGLLESSEYKKNGYKTYDYDGHTYYIYQRDNLTAPWRIYTICQEDAIYGGAKSVCIIVLITSLVGMLLMLLSCIVIFRQMRKDMRRKAAAEEELKMAAKVQTSMLPAPDYTCKGQQTNFQAFMQPAREAGGDLYYYVEKNGRLIFCIGDVSGKGMPAALFMTQVISLFRNAVLYTDTPIEIVSQMNDVLSQNNPDMTFCTCIVGVIEGYTITYCNAGHNHPVLVQANSQPSFLRPHPNIALGLMEGYPFKHDTLTLTPSDRLLLYTDGVTEAMNKAHEQYGEDRLIDVLSNCSTSDDLCASVLHSVKTFVGSAPQSDDITIVYINSRPNGEIGFERF